MSIFDQKSAQRSLPTTRFAGWVLCAGFVVLAGVLFASPRSVEIPIAPANAVDRSLLVVGPRREAMKDPPRLLVEGVPENCNACHQIFKSSHAGGEAINYHQELKLSHGLNNRCMNCHDAQDRERLTLRDGATVSFAESPRLCSQCHGTVYRDWEKGTHGKTLGSWVTDSQSQRRLVCNECHDPHSPKYEAMQPLPGPNTLRMGEQTLPHSGEGKRSPLQRWLKGHGDAAKAPVQHEEAR